MTDASWMERAALLAVIAVSVTWFARRLNRVLSIIRRARPTPDFEVAPIGPRVRQFVWEVCCKAK